MTEMASLLIEMLHAGEFNDLVREAIRELSPSELTQLAQMSQAAQSSCKDTIKQR